MPSAFSRRRRAWHRWTWPHHAFGLIMERKEFYLNPYRCAHCRHRCAETTQSVFVAGEIITFLAALGFVVLYTVIHDAAWTLGAAALIFIVYVLIRRMDVRNGSAIDDLTDLRSAYQHEVSYLEGDYSCFSDGERYLDPHHPFTFDLDIFGRDSLFNRMNRTITSGGSDRLAEYLSFASVSDQSDAIDILAADETWRTKFISLGQRQQIDTNSILVALNDAGKTKITSAAGSRGDVRCCVATDCWLFRVRGAFHLRIGPLQTCPWWGILQFFECFRSPPVLWKR